MGLKRFKDNFGDTGFMKGWEDEVKDLMIEIRSNEVVEVRFVGLFLPAPYHWVPFMSKKRGKMSFFPQMCLDWDLKEGTWLEEGQCPACDLELMSGEHAISPVILVETLLDGDVDNALKIFNVGPRERTKVANLQKYNKVDGIPTDVADPQHGRGVMVLHDPDQKDPANRWQFNMGHKLQIRLINDETQVQVRIPKKADSPIAGEVVTLDIPDLEGIVYHPKAKDLHAKYKRMKVDEAMAIYLKQKKKDKDDDDDGDDRGRRRGSRRRDEDDNDDDRGSRRGSSSPRSRGRRDRDEGDWGGDDTYDDTGSDDGDTWGDEGEDDEERQPRRPSSRREGRRRPKQEEGRRPEGRRRPKQEEGKQEEGRRRSRPSGGGKPSGGKKPRKPPCFGHMGDDDTEDCTVCKVRKRCIAASE